MMFKNLSIYKLGQWPADTSQLADATLKEMFAPASPTQQKSIGWIAPRDGGSRFAFVESIAGQWIARFVIETRSVPAQALKDAVEAKCAAITAETGRHPGKKERRDLRDDALLELLPRAFPRRAAINVWIRPTERMLIIGTDSQSKVDEVINSLVRVAGHGFTVAPLQTTLAPQAWMAQCVFDEDDAGPFDLGRSYQLQGTGDEPEKYRVDGAYAATAMTEQLVRDGVLPIELALTYNDRVSFTLTRTLALKRIKLIDIQPDQPVEEADRFYSECALWTGSLAPVIDDVIQALGGEV